MDIITRAEWNAQPPARDYVNIAWSDRPGTETHHSVGVYGTDNPYDFAWEVQDDHLGRGWTDIFYNYLIWYDGRIVEGRPDHAKSGPIEHLTVCFAGNYNSRQLDDRQKRSWWQLRHHATGHGAGMDVAWHGQRDAVECPGDNVIGWLRAGHPNPEGTPVDAVILIDHTEGTPDAITGLQALFLRPDQKVGLVVNVDAAKRALREGKRVYAVGRAARLIDGDTDLAGANRIDTADEVLAQGKSGW